MLMGSAFFFNGYLGANFPNQTNEDISSLVQTVIQETGSPARALQALQHVIFTNRYYKYLPMFNVGLQQHVSYSVQAIQPVRFRGYVAVMASLGVHLLLVSYILFTFGVLRGTRKTIVSINQVWLVFAQVSTLRKGLSLGSDERESTTTTDRIVERDLKIRGLNNKIYILDGTDYDGGVRFRKKDG
jgi:hypothetical protein